MINVICSLGSSVYNIGEFVFSYITGTSRLKNENADLVKTLKDGWAIYKKTVTKIQSL